MASILIDKTSYPINKLTYDLLIRFGVHDSIATFLNCLLLLFTLCILVIVLQVTARIIIENILKEVSKSSSYSFFDHLLENKFSRYLALIVPISLVKNSIEIVFTDYPKWIPIVDKLTDVYMIFALIWLITSILYACMDLLKEHPTYNEKPLESYLQIIKLILYLFGVIIIFSIFTGKSPLAFFTAMGAMSAVLLLMFKDTIMGFVASIQVTTNDMVRIGDWVTMSKYGADGDVIEINLTTVKIQNFDKTITTIPTYALTSESFQNWRGMQESGGRRIKRSIFIKQSHIQFIDKQDLGRYEKIQGIQDYIQEKSIEIQAFNKKINADKSIQVNGRNLTNMGLYRKYVEWYLKNHPDIHQKMTLMVRQLAPSELGLPLEIYAFTNTTNWKEYENIMADVFDHLISSVKYFDLEIFENIGNEMRVQSV